MKLYKSLCLAAAATAGLLLSTATPCSAGGNFQRLQTLLAQQALESAETSKESGKEDLDAQAKEREKQRQQLEEKKKKQAALQSHDMIRINGKSPAEASYRLNPEAGEVRFGDGAQGRRLPSGEAAESVPSYRKGTPAKRSVPASTSSSQHNQSDLDFLKQRVRMAEDSGREVDDPAHEGSDRDE